jgi:SAM-dependent methyltransferase
MIIFLTQNPAMPRTQPNEKMPASFKPLDWRDRPASIQAEIDTAWNSMKDDIRPTWKFNGSNLALYKLAYLDEFRMLKSIIRENYPHRKDYYVLDVGAGEFGFSNKMVCLVNDDSEIPRDITVHVIGVRGEKNPAQENFELGICKQYNLGYFKIENILNELEARNLDLLQKIDLIVTQWSLRHLVDPLGTFLQIYNDLLRPETGFFLLDGFMYQCDWQTNDVDAWTDNVNMYRLALESGASFLVDNYNETRSLNRLVLVNTRNKKCHLPLAYDGTECISHWGVKCQVESDRVTRFRVLDSRTRFGRKLELIPSSVKGPVLSGSDFLYETLVEREYFSTDSSSQPPEFTGALSFRNGGIATVDRLTSTVNSFPASSSNEASQASMPIPEARPQGDIEHDEADLSASFHPNIEQTPDSTARDLEAPPEALLSEMSVSVSFNEINTAVTNQRSNQMPSTVPELLFFPGKGEMPVSPQEFRTASLQLPGLEDPNREDTSESDTESDPSFVKLLEPEPTESQLEFYYYDDNNQLCFLSLSNLNSRCILTNEQEERVLQFNNFLNQLNSRRLYALLLNLMGKNGNIDHKFLGQVQTLLRNYANPNARKENQLIIEMACRAHARAFSQWQTPLEVKAFYSRNSNEGSRLFLQVVIALSVIAFILGISLAPVAAPVAGLALLVGGGLMTIIGFLSYFGANHTHKNLKKDIHTYRNDSKQDGKYSLQHQLLFEQCKRAEKTQVQEPLAGSPQRFFTLPDDPGVSLPADKTNLLTNGAPTTPLGQCSSIT